MRVHSGTVPVRFYSQFFSEWGRLSPRVRHAFTALLEMLQADPENLRAAAFFDVHERQGRDPIVAFALPEDFVVYLTIRHWRPNADVKPEPTSIDVLAVAPPEKIPDSPMTTRTW
jgi:hypothetical protein